jgi:hypothetical protein
MCSHSAAYPVFAGRLPLDKLRVNCPAKNRMPFGQNTCTAYLAVNGDQTSGPASRSDSCFCLRRPAGEKFRDSGTKSGRWAKGLRLSNERSEWAVKQYYTTLETIYDLETHR